MQILAALLRKRIKEIKLEEKKIKEENLINLVLEEKKNYLKTNELPFKQISSW